MYVSLCLYCMGNQMPVSLRIVVREQAMGAGMSGGRNEARRGVGWFGCRGDAATVRGERVRGPLEGDRLGDAVGMQEFQFIQRCNRNVGRAAAGDAAQAVGDLSPRLCRRGVLVVIVAVRFAAAWGIAETAAGFVDDSAGRAAAQLVVMETFGRKSLGDERLPAQGEQEIALEQQDRNELHSYECPVSCPVSHKTTSPRLLTFQKI